uniref:Melanocortin 2 receptor accessory protein n=1 Tax=Ficedula albicollis TaxID=59894 RepID=A0A803W5M1_FICAL
MANRTNSSEYFWSYEYYWDYIDPIPVDGSKLEVNKYSIVIAFWVGLAAFVTFLFLILLCMSCSGSTPHPISVWKPRVSFPMIILIHSPNKCTLTSLVKAGELLPSSFLCSSISVKPRDIQDPVCPLTSWGEEAASRAPCARASPPSQPRFPPQHPIQPCPLAVLIHSPCPVPPSLILSLSPALLEPL